MTKFILALMLLSTSLIAETENKDNFLKSLKQQEEGLTKRLNEVHQAISCVERAADSLAQRKCREEFRSKRQAFRQELREKAKSESNDKGQHQKNKTGN